MHKDKIELIYKMEAVSQRCVFAVEYFNAITDKGSEFWAFTQNCYGEMACLLWCHLFKSYKDGLHYKNLFGNDALINIGKAFSYDEVRARLLQSISLTEKEYSAFRKEVIDFRDKFVAHKEASNKGLIFPQIDITKDMCLELRNIFTDLYNAAMKKAPQNTEIQNWVTFYKWYSNDWLIKKCKNELKGARVIS